MITKPTTRLSALASLRITPVTPFLVLFRNRHLLRRLSAQELQSRYRGSLLGIFWSVLLPLSQLLVFTFVFTAILPGRWGASGAGVEEFALIMFAGLIIYGLFSEVIGRSPGLLLENTSYLKKVVFSVELLAASAIIVALVNALISLVILLAFHVAIRGAVPVSITALPLILIPFLLLICGLSWFLSATGVYIRDLRYAVGPVLSLLMFLSPVFYPGSTVPENYRWILALNPLAWVIEQTRAVIIHDLWPDWPTVAWLWGLGLVSFWLGYLWFCATRRGFADVA